jgi:hypothetical protein
MLRADKDSGQVAFGAAALTTNVRRLVLYEGWPVRTLLFRPPGRGL